MEYNLQDIVKLYGTKQAVAQLFDMHPAQVTRWRDTIPDAYLPKFYRILEADPALKRKYQRIRRERIATESGETA